jgi:periodic tryptophan protein 1
MSGTLISSLAWVPRGRAALEPKKYTLDEAELERVGKLAGPEALEALKEQMEKMEMDEAGGDWEEVDDGEDADDGNESGKEDESEDEDMEGDKAPDAPVKPHDPNDLSAFKMDEYDDDNAGVGMCLLFAACCLLFC